jgi:hypothetical protein
MAIEKIRDDLYIKKGWDGYRVVYPNKIDLNKPLLSRNPETNKLDNIHWKNFIGLWHFWLKSAFVLIALYFFVQAYLSDTATCRKFIENLQTNCIEYMSTFASPQQNKTTDFFIIPMNLSNEIKETS